MSELYEILMWPAPFISLYFAIRLGWGVYRYGEPFWIWDLKKRPELRRKK